MLSTVITYAYVPEAGPEMKTLVIPFYVTEPNKVQLEVSSLGKPQMANIRVQGPMNVENSTNAIGIFTTTITQPGKYVIVVSASNVKSLSAQLVLNRTAFQQTSTDQNIWILAALVLVTLVAAYLFRKKILSMFMKGRFASVRISPEKPRPKQPVEIRFTADSKPIAGAKVTVLTFKGDAYTYTTRADGSIVFMPVEAGTYRLAITGYTIFGSDEFEVR